MIVIKRKPVRAPADALDDPHADPSRDAADTGDGNSFRKDRAGPSTP